MCWRYVLVAWRYVLVACVGDVLAVCFALAVCFGWYVLVDIDEIQKSRQKCMQGWWGTLEHAHMCLLMQLHHVRAFGK